MASFSEGFQQSFILADKNVHLTSYSYFVISPFSFWLAKCSIICWGGKSDREDPVALLWLIQQPLGATAAAAGPGIEPGCSTAEGCCAVVGSAAVLSVSHSLSRLLLGWVSTTKSSAVKQS